MAGSYGVYGDRFAGMGQIHALRGNWWLTLDKDGVRSYVRWDEVRSRHWVPGLSKALEFEGVFHGEGFTLTVGKIRPMTFWKFWTLLNKRLTARGYKAINEEDARALFDGETLDSAERIEVNGQQDDAPRSA
jgi:hypothetical protein